MKEINIPKWLKDLPPEGLLSYKEIMSIFGYPVCTPIKVLVDGGVIPKPTDSFFCKRKKRYFWKACVVRRWLNIKEK